MINKLTVIGVGLIGGSLIRALREAELLGQVIGCSSSDKTLKTALKLNIIDIGESNIAEAVIGADMVVIATPIGAIKSVFEQIAPIISSDTIVTDVCSAKVAVINILETVLGYLPSWFVPGHPISGTENSGVEHSFDTLFSNRKVILTPTKSTDPNALLKVQQMWEAVGSNVILLDAQIHDDILAKTSHLPHILAYSLINLLSTDPLSFEYSGGGLRDFARIALSDPKMWRDICLANNTEIIKSIQSYQQQLTEVLQYIKNNDAEKLYEFFNKAQKTREKL